MVVRSAGILLIRPAGGWEVLLGHPGGPFYARRDDGVWSIPKGEYTDGEDARTAAGREFREELGHPPPAGPEWPLGEVRLPSGKRLTVWAVRGDLDTSSVVGNPVEVEWPPRSGHRRSFPEIDRAAWFDLDTARRKLARGQAAFLDRLPALTDTPGG